MSANDRQVGGDHYRKHGDDKPQHWDLAILFDWDPFQYQITKYVMRWKYKNGLQDLEKGLHFYEKYIEAVKAGNYLTEADEPSPQTELSLAVKQCDELTRAISQPEVDTFQPGTVNANGWRDYVFEGSDAKGFLYTCRRCRYHFYAPPESNPHHTHDHLFDDKVTPETIASR